MRIPVPTSTMTDGSEAIPRGECTFETQFVYVLRHYDKHPLPRFYTSWHSFAGFRWRFLIFPQGNQCTDYLSVYLDCGGPLSQPVNEVEEEGGNGEADGEAEIDLRREQWSVKVEFDLKVVHPESLVGRAWLRKGIKGWKGLEDASSMAKSTSHIFLPHARDWGFLEFASFEDLQPGRYADEEMNVIVEVCLKVTEDLMPYDELMTSYEESIA